MSGAYLLTFGPALLTWLAVACKLPALRRRLHDFTVRAYWLCLLVLAVAQTVLLPPMYVTIDRFTGVPNLARLLGNGVGVVGCWIFLVYLFHLNYPGAEAWPRLRRAGGALGAVLILMVGLFVLAPVDEEDVEFMHRYGDAPFIMEYRLVFLTAVGLTCLQATRLLWRYADAVARPTLRHGLRLMALGGLAGLSYALHEGCRVAARRLGLPFPVSHPEIVTPALTTIAVGLVVIGATMPAWGPRVGLTRLYRWAARYDAYQRLYPLWRAVYQANPDIALFPPPSRLVDALAVRDLRFRLYRRVVEIRDGCLALRPYLDPRAAHYARELCQAAGLSEEETQAIVEAASVAAALRAKAQGRSAPQPIGTVSTLGGTDLESEVIALERVARYFGHSPLVRAVLARLDDEARVGVDRTGRQAERP